MDAFQDHKSIGVFDVDCTAAGKPLCDSNGVRGFPTIKHGDPTNLEDYQGGRDFKALKEFADELKPICSPTQRDLCDEEQLAEIDRMTELGKEGLEALIKDGEQSIQDAEDLFKAEVQKLQDKYEQLQEDQKATVAEVKASGLGLQKSVLATL